MAQSGGTRAEAEAQFLTSSRDRIAQLVVVRGAISCHLGGRSTKVMGMAHLHSVTICPVRRRENRNSDTGCFNYSFRQPRFFSRCAMQGVFKVLHPTPTRQGKWTRLNSFCGEQRCFFRPDRFILIKSLKRICSMDWLFLIDSLFQILESERTLHADSNEANFHTIL